MTECGMVTQGKQHISMGVNHVPILGGGAPASPIFLGPHLYAKTVRPI